jgi:Protein of unknown function (DUF3352)
MLARRRSALLLAGAAIALPALAGCGGDDDVDVGPAAAVPESTPVYVEANVRPEGQAKTDAEGALGKILDTDDAGAKLQSLIEQSAKGELKSGETFTFAEDVDLWLGERLAVFFHSFEEDEDATVVVESRDNEAALSALREDSGVTGETKEIGGITFDFDSDEKTYFGAVGDFIVSGPEEGVAQAVEAFDGDSLGDSDEFKDSIEDLPEDSLGTLYALPRNFIEAIPEGELDPVGLNIIERTAGDALEEPVLGDVTASAEAIELDLSAGGGGLETPDSSLLEGLPAQSWLGLALGNLGDSVDRSLEGIEEEEAPGFDLETIRSQVELATGLELDQIVDALGNSAVFVEGTREAELAGALIVESEDPQVTSELLTKLQSVIEQAGDPGEVRVRPLASASGDVGFELVDPTGQEVPQPIQIVQQDDKVVIGYGSGSVQRALGGAQGAVGGTLSTTPGYAAAAGQLEGTGVDLFLAFAPVFQLAESEGAKSDPEYVEAKPYVDALDYLALGSGDEGDRAELRVVLGLK